MYSYGNTVHRSRKTVAGSGKTVNGSGNVVNLSLLSKMNPLLNEKYKTTIVMRSLNDTEGASARDRI